MSRFENGILHGNDGIGVENTDAIIAYQAECFKPGFDLVFRSNKDTSQIIKLADGIDSSLDDRHDAEFAIATRDVDCDCSHIADGHWLSAPFRICDGNLNLSR